MNLPHEWDEDAYCIHCGYEAVNSDRVCEKRTEEARRKAYWADYYKQKEVA